MVRDFEEGVQCVRLMRRIRMRGRCYPAIFTPIDHNYYDIRFPDFSEIMLQGETIEGAKQFAGEYLTLHLRGLKKKPPLPTLMDDLKPEEGQFIMEIGVDRTLSFECYKYFIRDELTEDAEIFDDGDMDWPDDLDEEFDDPEE